MSLTLIGLGKQLVRLLPACANARREAGFASATPQHRREERCFSCLRNATVRVNRIDFHRGLIVARPPSRLISCVPRDEGIAKRTQMPRPDRDTGDENDEEGEEESVHTAPTQANQVCH